MASHFTPAMMAMFRLNENVGEFIAYTSLGLACLAVLVRLPSFYKEKISRSRTSKIQGIVLLNDSQGKIRSRKRPPSTTGNDNGFAQDPSYLLSLRQIFNKVFNLKIPFTGGFVLSQLLVIIIYMVALVVLSIYKNTDSKTNITNYRRFGFISIGQMPLLVTLAMKNSPITFFIGEGYEKLNFLHRFVGRMVFVFGLVHGALQIRLQRVMTKSFRLHHSSLYGFIALCAFFLIAVTSLRFVRNSFYQFFMIAHIVGYVTAIVALWYHTPATQPYIAYVIAAIGFDNLMKLVKARVKRANFTAMPGGLTRIEIHGINEGWRAGQHIFIRVLKGRHIFEKHPFTIANAPNSSSPHGSTNHMVLVAKAVGDFTKSIHQLAGAPRSSDSLLDVTAKEKIQNSPDLESENKLNDKNVMSNTTFPVIIDGPYGTFFTDLTQYRNVMLCAGGSGFTYCMATLEDIVGEAVQGGRNITRNITVVWSLRDPDMVESFAPAIENTVAVGQAHDISITIKLFITSHSGIDFGQNILPNTLVDFSSTRPNLPQIVDDIIDKESPSGMNGAVNYVDNNAGSAGGLGIGVCGPVGLVDQMKEIVRRLDESRFRQIGGVTLHSERFGW